MIFKIAFNIVGFGMLIGCGYAGIKMLSLAFLLRQRNAEFIGKSWNGRATSRQLRKLRMITPDEISKKSIDEFLKFARMRRVFLIAGVGLFILIGFWNSVLNK